VTRAPIPKMSPRSQLIWALAQVAVIGFLWVIFAPGCYGGSLLYPSVFGAAIIGFVSGREKAGPEIDEGPMALWLGCFIMGWGTVIVAVPAVFIGWFLGGIVCVNLLPKFGYFQCIDCL